MNSNQMQSLRKEEVEKIKDLSLVTSARVPYITYKELRYVYLDTAGEYFVSKNDMTYPQMATFLSEEVLTGSEGEMFTSKETENISSILDKKEEENKLKEKESKEKEAQKSERVEVPEHDFSVKKKPTPRKKKNQA